MFLKFKKLILFVLSVGVSALCMSAEQPRKNVLFAQRESIRLSQMDRVGLFTELQSWNRKEGFVAGVFLNTTYLSIRSFMNNQSAEPDIPLLICLVGSSVLYLNYFWNNYNFKVDLQRAANNCAGWVSDITSQELEQQLLRPGLFICPLCNQNSFTNGLVLGALSVAVLCGIYSKVCSLNGIE